jgi:hypothetical protein
MMRVNKTVSSLTIFPLIRKKAKKLRLRKRITLSFLIRIRKKTTRPLTRQKLQKRSPYNNSLILLKNGQKPAKAA